MSNKSLQWELAQILPSLGLTQKFVKRRAWHLVQFLTLKNIPLSQHSCLWYTLFNVFFFFVFVPDLAMCSYKNAFLWAVNQLFTCAQLHTPTVCSQISILLSWKLFLSSSACCLSNSPSKSDRHHGQSLSWEKGGDITLGVDGQAKVLACPVPSFLSFGGVRVQPENRKGYCSWRCPGASTYLLFDMTVQFVSFKTHLDL